MPDHAEQPGTLADILKQRRARRIRNIVLLVLVIGIAAAVWWVIFRPEDPVVVAVEAVSETAAPITTPEPIVPQQVPDRAPTIPSEPATPPVPAPTLETSDPLVRQLVGALTSRPEVAVYLASDELIRRFVASVDAIAEGRTPREQLEPMWPREPFTTIQVVDAPDAEVYVVSAESHDRYDTLTEIVVAIDSQGAASSFNELRPLIEEAYRQLGYPDRNFDDALRAAFAQLLSTPVVVGEVRLVPRVIGYGYEDPELEALSAAQKQLLRLGPVNAPRIQRKLRELASALGIPASDLPLTPIYTVPARQPEVMPRPGGGLLPEEALLPGGVIE
jgi:hypothetical protein